MDENGRRELLRRVEESRSRGDPSGWCESVYRSAEGDPTAVFWADLAPNPHLLSWLEEHGSPRPGAGAVVVGCGVGDDAEALAEHGYRVTAFDIAPSAIDLCRGRYPRSEVEYVVADLFALPPGWTGAFDLVFECNTIQIMEGAHRRATLEAIADLAAPGGAVLVSCRSREPGEKEDAFPLPLDREEMGGFVRAGLTEEGFVAYDDDQDPPVPHFFAWYRRPAGSRGSAGNRGQSLEPQRRQ
jgi:SAM-dependent methyltransferase